MAAAVRAVPLFGGRQSIPFAFYRSGTSRGLFLLERDVPPKGPDRDALLFKLMGSGHPQQLEGFGGGCGPTSKAVIVGPHTDPGSVTYMFMQCNVDEAVVDHSHGDCGNMIAAVAPFALEAGLVPLDAERPLTTVHIHSLSTGSLYSSGVRTEAYEGGRRVCYDGDLVLPGVPGAGAPVQITTHGIAGSQTCRLLPTGRLSDRFDLGPSLGEVEATVVDFARALILLDAREVLPHFGYGSLQDVTAARVQADAGLNAALERVRRMASLAMGMGDCTGKDAPKIALLAPSREGSGMLSCRYWVNPERCEMHPTLAMTAAQAVGAACFLGGGVARGVLAGAARPSLVEGRSTFVVEIAHPKGVFPVEVNASAAAAAGEEDLFPHGRPDSASYTSTVRPIAEGQAFV